MGSDIATRPSKPIDLKKLLLDGDLSKLDDDQKLQHMLGICDRLGIDPSTRPFEYLVLDKRLVLYPRKDCTEQLRKVHRISLGQPQWDFHWEQGFVRCWVEASTPDGRKDGGTGAATVFKRVKNEETGFYQNEMMTGADLSNAIKKCETQAKRRATLSIEGLGMMDESEIEDCKGVGSIGPITDVQTSNLMRLIAETGAKLDTWKAKYDVKTVDELNTTQAGEIIAFLQESLKLQSL